MDDSVYDCPDAHEELKPRMDTGEDIYANVTVYRRPLQDSPVVQKSGRLKLAVVCLALLCAVLLAATIGMGVTSTSERAALQNQICNLERTIKLYRVNISLDRDTAHPLLLVSPDLKQVRRSQTKQNYTESPKRFVDTIAVLGAEGFSSGKFYYEVQVSGKISWTLGVVRESITRNGSFLLKPSDGFWGIWLRYSRGNKIYESTRKYIDVEHEPETVGVFVDYKAGNVSFYDADTWKELCSYRGADFREKIYPYFNPYSVFGGKNSAPLIIQTPNLCQKQ
ncbi:hypothetical protein ACEWY4_024601 [Coilia grayii]|uniref:B30.2/SPRY domain-containing protein n=1 Tax=Coilia grayii TaxID=363190 RepID=A0ABD1IV67_9TELE